MTNNTWDEYHEQRITELEAELDRLRQQVADLYTAARQNADLRRELTQLEVSADKALADAGDEILELRAENERLRALLPDWETRAAIYSCITDSHELVMDESRRGSPHAAKALAWLEGLERP